MPCLTTFLQACSLDSGEVSILEGNRKIHKLLLLHNNRQNCRKMFALGCVFESQRLFGFGAVDRIQRYRFGNRFDVRYDIDTSDIQIMYYRVPKLILQPLIENAIQHGLEDLPSGGLITISAFHTRTRLYISVEDNGKGADAETLRDINRRLCECRDDTPNSGSGIALLNIQKRIRFQYGQEFGLKLLSGAERGLCAELELPWVDHE